MNYTAMERKTCEALADPIAGDRFHEMYSFWMYVVKVTKRSVTVMEASPPCVFPEDARVREITRAEFQCHYGYPSPWILLADRGNDVSGWLA